MAGAAETLQGDRDRARRADLNDQIDRPDIDAEFERCGGDHGSQFAVFQAGFRIEAQRAREAAVVRQHDLRPEPLRQRMRDAFGKPPRIHENKRGAMRENQCRARRS